MVEQKNDDITRLLLELVEVSRKSRNAARSIARVIMIQLVSTSSASIVAALAFLSNPLEPSIGGLVFSAAIWITGVIVAIRAGYLELFQSESPVRISSPYSRPSSIKRISSPYSRPSSNKKTSVPKTEGRPLDVVKLDKLTRVEYSEWIRAGRPNVSSWNGEDFLDWLERVQR